MSTAGWERLLREERAGVRHDAATLKSCCAEFYAHDWARLLLGDSFHPGGLETTERLAAALDLGRDDRVLDVACGTGASLRHLVDARGIQAVGVDFGAETVERARREARNQGLRIEFVEGDAERLPLDDASFDAIICECSFCIFPDKAAAAREIARVLLPGGRVGISDICREGELDPELETLRGWVSCVADAYPAEAIADALTAAGLEVVSIERDDGALAGLIRNIGAKLLALEVGSKLGKVELPAGIEFEEAKRLRKLAARAVSEGRLGYVLVTARKPTG